MSGMRTRNEAGIINSLLLPLLVAVFLLVGVAFFGVWAYGSRQDYKNNTDAKIASAVTAAKAAEDKVKDAQFAEQLKSPLRTYTGPSAYGSVVIKYPNTWSAYVSDTSTNDPFIDGYFAPNIVPDVQAQTSRFGLRVQVTSRSYSDELKQFQSSAEGGKASIQPYALPGVPSVVGAYISGEIGNDKQGYMVILPLRNTTLKLWTEADQYKADFNDIILANASFSP
jgi:hypothetical protein